MDWSTVMSSGRGTAVTVVVRATARSARIAASAMPSSTATMRSKAIVAVAVITSTTASGRVARTTARTLWISTIRTAVSISTPASAASGISDDERSREQNDEDQHHRVGDRGEARPRPGAHVDGGACDRSGRRHPSEERRGKVRESLAEQLAVRIVTS